MHLLEFQDVSHSYPGTATPALAGLSLTLDGGQVTALVGPSGCGKSTALLIAGLLMQPTAGEVLLDGRPASRLAEEERTALRADGLGFLFQEARLIRHLTVLENVVVPLLATTSSADTSHALELLDFVGLAELTDRLPGTLSGGQAQRVAFCRALVRHPRVVLADEPTASLDAAAADDLRRLLAEVVDTGVGVLVATHDPQMMQWAGSRIHMERGAVVPAPVGGAPA